MPVITDRSPRQGFVGTDGQTHSIGMATDITYRSDCKEAFWKRSVRAIGVFRVTPGAPLCSTCVTAIEDRIRRKE